MNIVGIGIPKPADPAHPTPREVARLIITARQVEVLRLHAERERCAPHHLLVSMAAPAVMERLPRWFRRNRDHHHRYIHMPAARKFFRELDR